MTPKTKKDIFIRWLESKDYTDVFRIETEGFVNPKTREELEELTKKPQHIAFVIETKKKLVGFLVFQLFKSKLLIIRFAVDQNHWRQGIGTALIDKVKNACTGERKTIECYVHENNLRAQLFFSKKCGFTTTKTSIKKDYYPDGDAYKMTWREKKDNSK